MIDTGELYVGKKVRINLETAWGKAFSAEAIVRSWNPISEPDPEQREIRLKIGSDEFVRIARDVFHHEDDFRVGDKLQVIDYKDPKEVFRIYQIIQDRLYIENQYGKHAGYTTLPFAVKLKNRVDQKSLDVDDVIAQMYSSLDNFRTVLDTLVENRENQLIKESELADEIRILQNRIKKAKIELDE